MKQKIRLRKKYSKLRKKKYYEIDRRFFLPLLKIIKLRFKKRKIKIALYYPSSFELNVLKFLEFSNILKKDILLPVINKKNLMSFYSWKKNDLLFINEFGIPEPAEAESKVPDVILVPVLAFDKNKYRLGYGKGFYDRYLNKYLKQFKNILTVGVAFSFQRHHNLPKNHNDVKLLIISIIFVGIFSFIIQIAFRGILYGNMGRSRKKDGKGSAALLIIILVVSIIAYLISLLFKFAISRKREFLADAGAAEMTRKPSSLANALQKISSNSKIDSIRSDDIKQLFIDNSPDTKSKNI